MHLHGSGILHGNISPVGDVKDQVNPRSDARRVQDNILITQDGQACLGDFAIAAAFDRYSCGYHQQETLRCMAPERIKGSKRPVLFPPSKESDVYSFTMASFSVRTSFENHPTT